MARTTNRDRIIKLLFDERDGLSSAQIKQRLNLPDKTYDRERERLLLEGLAQKTKGRGGGLKLTQAFLGFLENNDFDEWLDDQKAGFGSAFFVSSNGYLLTNHHVIEGCQRIVAFHNGQRYVGSVHAADAEKDLALVKIDFRPQKVAVFRTAVRLGEDVGLFGFPMPEVLTKSGNFSRGSVTGLAGIDDEVDQFQIQVPVQGGNSGGPVVDANGNVLGVVVSGLNKVFFSENMPENANFAIRAEVARQFVASSGVTIRTTSRVPNSSDWTRVARRSRAISALLYCDEGFGDVADYCPPKDLFTDKPGNSKVGVWLITAILVGIGTLLFAFRSQLGF